MNSLFADPDAEIWRKSTLTCF